MNNFYDDVFDMVPFERPNLAVEQLSVNENGDVGVDGSLSIGGAVYAQKWATIASDGISSHLYMRGSGNPKANNVDVDIAVTGGVSGQADHGVLTATAKGGISLDAGANYIQSNCGATVLKSSLYIDSPGTGTYLSFFGTQPFDSTKPGIQQLPAAQMDVQGGTSSTPNQGIVNMYAARTNFHGDVFIDPTSNGNLFLGATTTSGNGFAMMRFYADSGTPKLGILWSGVWWWFTPSSHT